MTAVRALRDEIKRQALRGGPTQPGWLRALRLANDAAHDQDVLVDSAADYLIDPTDEHRERLTFVVNRLSGADKAFAAMEDMGG